MRHRGLLRKAIVTVTLLTAATTVLAACDSSAPKKRASRSASQPPPPISFQLLPELPNASNTGVPAGTALRKSGSITVTKAGTVLSGLDISGMVYVQASNVRIENSRITGSAYFNIRIDPKLTGVVISNVEINGLGTRGMSGSDGVFGPATVLRTNIYNVENGIVPFSGSVIQDSYIHDLSAPGDPHYDGIQMDGGLSDITIRHNTVINNHDQTSAVMIDNGFGPMTNINVTDNLLAGGGYTVYADGQFHKGAIDGITFSGNRLGKGYWGYYVIRYSTVTWTDNIDNTTSKPVADDY